MKKLLIIGHARHGKDTVAEIIFSHFGYTFKASSVAASEIFLYEKLKDKYGYKTPEECFIDRINHRTEWHDLICEFNLVDKSALAKRIMHNSDIYVGMRSDEEVQECKKHGIFDIIIGVFNPNKELESRNSFNINIWETADFVIPNALGIKELESRVLKFRQILT